mgnify:CR=1 FL=1
MSPFRWGVFALTVLAGGLSQAQEMSSLRPPARSLDELPDATLFDGSGLDDAGGRMARGAGTFGTAPVSQRGSFAYVSNGGSSETAAADLGLGAGSAYGSRLVESTWYTREEYFHWRERLGGEDFVNEYGLLFTLGYQRRVGPERYRAELFGGTMHYDGGAQFEDGSTEPLESKTGYLGVRGEYDFLIEPDWLPKTSLLIGVGTRFWFRDLRDGMTESGVPVLGYQEMWWTIYPYLGAETRRVLGRGPELFISSRIGCTALTYEHATFFDAVLYPKTGLTGQLEAGIRGHHFFCSAISEVFAWRQSSIARGALQPESTLFTVGLRAGVNF